MRIASLPATCLLLIALAAPTIAAERPWRKLESPNYTVLSQLDDRDTVAWAREYDQFLAATTNLLKINPRSLPPLTAVLFRRDKDYEPYRLTRPDGKAARISGQFINRRSYSLIAMDYAGERSQTRQTIFHEATHWLLSGDPRSPPAWFSEGFAEMFSTFERNVETVNWAKPIASHLITLNQGALIPMEEFLTQPSAFYDSETRTGRFYAQSWAFVHMLLMSNDPALRAMLLEYIGTYRASSASVAMEQAFGADLEPLRSRLSSYVRQRSYGYVKLPIVAVAEPQPPTDAPPAMAEAALGLLALASGKMELARAHAQRGLALDGRQPRVHELLAYLSVEDDDDAAAGRHALEATRNGSRDPYMFLMVGESYASGAASEAADASRKRVNAYENAVNLNPTSYLAYERLMAGLSDLDKPTEEDAKFLALGRKAFPDDDWLKVGSALLAARLGHQAEAATLMDAALRKDGSLDEFQRQYAESRRRDWLFESLGEAIPEAMRKGDFAAARAAIDAARPHMAGDADAEQLLAQMQGAVEISEEMVAIQSLVDSGRKADARSRLDALLQRDDLPPPLRQAATTLRNRL